jgi:hypothetical protein
VTLELAVALELVVALIYSGCSRNSAGVGLLGDAPPSSFETQSAAIRNPVATARVRQVVIDFLRLRSVLMREVVAPPKPEAAKRLLVAVASSRFVGFSSLFFKFIVGFISFL